ncbi:MAG TPA: glycosyltransferase family 2 protein [Candidatus Bipolaricaulis anaerobius]|nr:glycosyltransferase family 2 protein [Candidatus Bipolaricaulis anaerobius]HNS24028.1 glycosyltransferase family 2 protein [Candidatus Bipolaricaulis anaerobius]
MVEYDCLTAEAGGIAEEEASLEAAPPERRLVLIKTGENLGFAGGMNVGVRYACAVGADYAWLINNDTVVASDALATLVEALKGRPWLGIAGPLELDYFEPGKVVDSVGVVRPWRGVIGGVPRDLPLDCQGCANVELLSGFNLFVRCDAVRAVGLMDERFFLYCEDAEWCVRMRKKGWQLLYISTARVWHKRSQSTGWGSPLMYYYTTRNQLRLFSMHFPYAVPAALVRSGLRALKLACYRRWSQCRGVVRGCWDWMRGKLGMAQIQPSRRGADAA